jgi:cbb3-type cytochrome oxidase subunit 3
MRTTYHFAMVPEKKSGLGTIVKIGLIAGGIYWAYRQQANKDADKGAGGAYPESPNAGSSELRAGVDAAAREAGDFAARVLKAAKKIPDALGK